MKDHREEWDLMRGKRGRHERIESRHRKKTSIETVGLRRTACNLCGWVSVEYVDDAYAGSLAQTGLDGETQPDTEPASG